MGTLTAVVYGVFALYTGGDSVAYDLGERHTNMRNCVMSAAMSNEWWMSSTVWGGNEVYFCKRIEDKNEKE